MRQPEEYFEFYSQTHKIVEMIGEPMSQEFMDWIKAEAIKMQGRHLTFVAINDGEGRKGYLLKDDPNEMSQQMRKEALVSEAKCIFILLLKPRRE